MNGFIDKVNLQIQNAFSEAIIEHILPRLQASVRLVFEWTKYQAGQERNTSIERSEQKSDNVLIGNIWRSSMENLNISFK